MSMLMWTALYRTFYMRARVCSCACVLFYNYFYKRHMTLLECWSRTSACDVMWCDVGACSWLQCPDEYIDLPGLTAWALSFRHCCVLSTTQWNKVASFVKLSNAVRNVWWYGHWWIGCDVINNYALSTLWSPVLSSSTYSQGTKWFLCLTFS